MNYEEELAMLEGKYDSDGRGIYLLEPSKLSGLKSTQSNGWNFSYVEKSKKKVQSNKTRTNKHGKQT